MNADSNDHWSGDPALDALGVAVGGFGIYVANAAGNSVSRFIFRSNGDVSPFTVTIGPLDPIGIG